MAQSRRRAIFIRLADLSIFWMQDYKVLVAEVPLNGNLKLVLGYIFVIPHNTPEVLLWLWIRRPVLCLHNFIWYLMTILKKSHTFVQELFLRIGQTWLLIQERRVQKVLWYNKNMVWLRGRHNCWLSCYTNPMSCHAATIGCHEATRGRHAATRF